MLFTHSVSRRATLVFALAAFLYPVSANGQSCGDTNCHRLFRPFRSSGSCAEAAPANAAPAETAPADAAPANEGAEAAVAPTMFAAPAPTGEIAGGRSSIALPSFRLSLPKISLETPELCLHGFTRFRRDPQMMIDGAAAPASHNNPLLFGQLTGASAQQTQSRRSAAAAPAAGAPADAAPAAVAPAEGCTSIESQRIEDLTRQIFELQKLAYQSSVDSSARTNVAQTLPGQTDVTMVSAKNDPWQNSAEFQLKACEQQMAGLESQIMELQKLVEKLATQGVSESQSTQKSPSSHGQRSQAVDPWSRDEQESDEARQESIIAAHQAQKVAILEAKLEELTREKQSTTKLKASEADGIAEPLIQPEQRQVKQRASGNKVKARTGILGKLEMALNRR